MRAHRGTRVARGGYPPLPCEGTALRSPAERVAPHATYITPPKVGALRCTTSGGVLLYMGVKRPVLLRRLTSTGHYYQPVLLRTVTSTASVSDHYWSLFRLRGVGEWTPMEWGSVAGTKT